MHSIYAGSDGHLFDFSSILFMVQQLTEFVCDDGFWINFLTYLNQIKNKG